MCHCLYFTGSVPLPTANHTFEAMWWTARLQHEPQFIKIMQKMQKLAQTGKRVTSKGRILSSPTNTPRHKLHCGDRLHMTFIVCQTSQRTTWQQDSGCGMTFYSVRFLEELFRKKSNVCVPINRSISLSPIVNVLCMKQFPSCTLSTRTIHCFTQLQVMLMTVVLETCMVNVFARDMGFINNSHQSKSVMRTWETWCLRK